MRFWNKQRRFRIAQWTKTSMPMSFRFSEMKKWCIANPSTGKFFALPSESRILGINKWDEPIVENKSAWWFEDPYDAVLFKMQWSGVS